MHVPLVCLLLSCAVALSGAGVIQEENGSPILWGHVATALADLTTDANGVVTPDPWHYQHRMGFYRILIPATDPAMGSMGTGENQSPLWGLPLQLGWMLTSGRLADSSKTTTCGVQTGDTYESCISTNSWWGCVNYFSSVLPFLSAAKANIFGEGVNVQMQIPAGVEGYCLTYEACKTAYDDPMTKWDAFYQGLKDSMESTLPDNEKKDAILGLYWAAQLSSTHSAATACQDKQTWLTSVERSFAQSWLNAGEYVAAVYFQSNLELSSQFMTPLPGRMLKEDDVPPNIADLTAEENHSLYIFSWMSTLDTYLGGTVLNMWRNAMCSVTARENGRDMLKQLLTPGSETSSFVSLVSAMSTSCSSPN